jgi:hypothetical protein
MPETPALPTRVALTPPHGLDEIRATFGDIFHYIPSDHTLDPRWQSEFLTRIALPFQLPLSWDKSRIVDHITCHKLIAVSFTQVFAEIKNAGLQDKITTFGGCFAFRSQRTGTKLSAHAWGIAIDLNPESNVQGTAGSIDAAIVSIFKQAGFTWGGDWKGRSRDPMHFQFCTGY